MATCKKTIKDEALEQELAEFKSQISTEYRNPSGKPTNWAKDLVFLAMQANEREKPELCDYICKLARDEQDQLAREAKAFDDCYLEANMTKEEVRAAEAADYKRIADEGAVLIQVSPEPLSYVPMNIGSDQETLPRID